VPCPAIWGDASTTPVPDGGRRKVMKCGEGSWHWLLENGRFEHAPLQSDTSIRVYTTADTDID